MTNDGVEVECCCKGKRHSKHCGCLTEKFIRKAKASFQMCLTNAGTDPNAFSEGLMNLALHHFQDEHQWDGGQCDFHPLFVCSCGSCNDKYNLKCHGKPYKSDHVLKCPFHALAYKLECQEKAGLADVLIHPEMGKVTTNPVEASHNVLVRYRSKNLNLARLHYHVSTNIGLIQGCMTYLFAKRGPRYHWILDILERMCLPVVQNLPSILQKLNEGRFFDIQSQKTNAAKAKRKLYKRKRKVFEHQRRQLFVKESSMYGGDVSTEEVIADASTDKCKCGSTDHRRISHKSCPLRRTCDLATGIDASCDIDASKSDDNVSENEDDHYDFESSLSDEMAVESCACPNFRRHKWDCPDNVRNRKRAMNSSLTPAGAFWTPPLKKVGLYSPKVPSPLVVSKVKGQSTPALGSVIVPYNASTVKKMGSPTVSTPSFILGKKLELSVLKSCSPSNTRVLPKIPQQSTPFGPISQAVSSVRKVGCTPTSVPKMPEVYVSLSKCSSPSMTPGPSQFNKQCSHLAVAEKVVSPSVHTPILLQRDLSVPHKTTGVDCVTVPHDNIEVAFHSLDSDCVIDEEKTKCAPKILHEMLPPPSTNRDWVQKAVAIISKLSGIAVVERVDAVKQVPCREIAPHIRDEIVGDGACLYRSISKAITGTEDNHFAVRMSLINFMLHPDNVVAFGRFLRTGISYDLDAFKAVKSHINRHRLYLKTSWSTEYEIFAAATMFQVKIMVYSEYSNYRDWHTYVPQFTNKTCMTPMSVMLYLYHINRNHYDLVIPVLD